MPPDYPRFRTFTANISMYPELYEEIMQDVHVDETGRYELLGEPQKYWDPKDCCFHVTFDYKDNGPT
jgi:hypothetical protein